MGPATQIGGKFCCLDDPSFCVFVIVIVHYLVDEDPACMRRIECKKDVVTVAQASQRKFTGYDLEIHLSAH